MRNFFFQTGNSPALPVKSGSFGGWACAMGKGFDWMVEVDGLSVKLGAGLGTGLGAGLVWLSGSRRSGIGVPKLTLLSGVVILGVIFVVFKISRY